MIQKWLATNFKRFLDEPKKQLPPLPPPAALVVDDPRRGLVRKLILQQDLDKLLSRVGREDLIDTYVGADRHLLLVPISKEAMDQIANLSERIDALENSHSRVRPR